ncbi:MAG: hypothetical protein O7H41_20740 [Planctomycetota bacterium]|nr:hypothetical protein [Planctomycetota bacterium]
MAQKEENEIEVVVGIDPAKVASTRVLGPRGLIKQQEILQKSMEVDFHDEFLIPSGREPRMLDASVEDPNHTQTPPQTIPSGDIRMMHVR